MPKSHEKKVQTSRNYLKDSRYTQLLNRVKRRQCKTEELFSLMKKWIKNGDKAQQYCAMRRLTILFRNQDIRVRTVTADIFPIFFGFIKQSSDIRFKEGAAAAIHSYASRCTKRQCLMLVDEGILLLFTNFIKKWLNSTKQPKYQQNQRSLKLIISSIRLMVVKNQQIGLLFFETGLQQQLMEGVYSMDKDLIFLLAEVYAGLIISNPKDIGGRIADKLSKIMLNQSGRARTIFLCRRTFMSCGFENIPSQTSASLDFKVRLLSILIPFDEAQNVTDKAIQLFQKIISSHRDILLELNDTILNTFFKILCNPDTKIKLLILTILKFFHQTSRSSERLLSHDNMFQLYLYLLEVDCTKIRVALIHTINYAMASSPNHMQFQLHSFRLLQILMGFLQSKDTTLLYYTWVMIEKMLALNLNNTVISQFKRLGGAQQVQKFKQHPLMNNLTVVYNKMIRQLGLSTA